MAEDSGELLKTLEENRRTLQKQIGCLAGLLRIFDRQCCMIGRRYGSNCTHTANEDITTSTTTCGTDVLHERGHELERRHVQPECEVSIREENEGPSTVMEQRVSVKKEEAVHSRLSSDLTPETSRIAGNETPQRETVPGHKTLVTPSAQRRLSADNTRLSFENVSRSPDSALIRNIVVNSLHKEKPRASVDNSNREVMAGLIRLKNLARSRSVGGRNGCSTRTGVEFPRSSSLRSSETYKGGSSAMSVRDQAPELLAREKVAPNLTHLQRSISENLRLNAETEEGAGVGRKKLQRRDAAIKLDESFGALDLKESFRALQREKSSRRSVEQASVAEVRVAYDGRRSPPRDEQEAGRRGGSNVVARLMGLESEFSSPKDAGSVNANRRGSQQRRGRSLSPKHLLIDSMPSPLQQQELAVREALKGRLTKSAKHLPLQLTPSPSLDPLHGDIIHRLQQLRSRNSLEERVTLNQILETLQLKGLLHSPQRKTCAKSPEYVRHRSATTNPGDCKSGRSECSERSEATTGTRSSIEDRGSTKHGARGRSRSPVRLNNDARSVHVKQIILQGQADSRLKDKRESKAALVTVRDTQSRGLSVKRNHVSDGITSKSCEAQSGKSSVEVIRQRRPLGTTSRDIQLLVPRPLSPSRALEDKSHTALETIEKEKPSPEEGMVAATQTSTDQVSCVDCQTLNITPARIREILQALKDKDRPLKDFSDAKEMSEGMTPRAGFQVEKTSPAVEKSGQSVEVCEQRSPVSVLDNSIFEEDGSPSPLPAVNLPDSYETNEHDHQCDEVRLENTMELATTSLTVIDHKYATSGGKGRDFVEELLMVSGSSKHLNWASEASLFGINHSDINPRFLKEDLQRACDEFFDKCHKQEQGKQMNMVNRQALIELLAFKMAEYENTQPWLESSWIGAGQEFFKRQNLVRAVWKELQEFPSAASDDICDTVKGILKEDLGSRGPKWTGFQVEIGEVGVEVEKLIYRDLVEEVVKDLKCSGSSRCSAKLLEGSSGPRRQLFAFIKQ